MRGDGHQIPELEMLDRCLALTIQGFLAKIELFRREYPLVLGYIIREEPSKKRENIKEMKKLPQAHGSNYDTDHTRNRVTPSHQTGQRATFPAKVFAGCRRIRVDNSSGEQPAAGVPTHPHLMLLMRVLRPKHLETF